MRSARLSSLICSTLCCLALLLAACGSDGTVNTDATATPGSTKIATSTSQPGGTAPTATAGQTQPEPPTQITCPNNTSGVGRAAIMKPLALGQHPAIAYIFNMGGQNNPSFAELKWDDVVNGHKTVIVHLTNDSISEASVSSDGQWVLFVTNYPQYAALQLVRMDGKGLQTLYCTTRGALRNVQWSPNQSQVIFAVAAISGLYDVYLLKMSSGQVQPEVVQVNSASLGYLPRTWADNARVYLTGVPNAQQGPPIQHGLYLLNINNGPNQTPGNLQTILSATSTAGCWDFDSDYNATTLLTSACQGAFSYSNIRAGILQGPSSIAKENITGSQPQTEYQNSADAVTQVRFLGYSSTSLLFTLNSQSLGSPGTIVDSSHNGIWKMNVDGSGVKELAPVDANNMAELNLFSQYPWANVSRNDGALYAIQVSSLGNGTTPPTYLEYGSLSGGSLTSFAFANEFAGSLAIAGWTTM